jgi:hypothetical protein
VYNCLSNLFLCHGVSLHKKKHFVTEIRSMVRSDHDQRQGGFCKRKLMNESIAVEKFGIMSDKLREKNKRHGIAKSQKKKVVKVVKVKGENGCINKKKVTPKIIKSNKKAHKVKSETIELPPTLNDQKIDLFGEEKGKYE